MAASSNAQTAREVVDQFMALFNRAISGEEVNPFVLVADTLEYTVTGQTPISMTIHGPQELVEKIFSQVVARVKREPGFGLYPYEYIQDGERLVVLMRGRGESARGIPYNNDYFFLFEVKDGKVVRMIEELDPSHVMQSIFNHRLEEKKPAA